MPAVQMRYQLSKPMRHSHPNTADDIGASLEDFELDLAMADSDLRRNLPPDYLDYSHSTFPDESSMDRLGLLDSSSIFQTTANRITAENIHQWSYPSPNSVQNWGPSDTEDDHDQSRISQVDTSASPMSTATTNSHFSSQNFTTTDPTTHSTLYPPLKSPATIDFHPFYETKRSFTRRRQAYSDTPAPAGVMSSPGVGASTYDPEIHRKPFRHSASPISQHPSRMGNPTGRYTPRFPIHKVHLHSYNDDATTQLESSENTAIPDPCDNVSVSSNSRPSDTDHELDRSNLTNEASSGYGDTSILEFITELELAPKRFSPSTGNIRLAAQATGDSLTIPDPMPRNRAPLSVREKNRNTKAHKVIKRRKQKDMQSLRPSPDKGSEQSCKSNPAFVNLSKKPAGKWITINLNTVSPFHLAVLKRQYPDFRFDVSAQMRPSSNWPSFFNIGQPSIQISVSRLWSLMMWMCGLGLTFMVCRSLFWYPNHSLVQGVSPGMMVPDLIKVAGLARSFEPLIHFSENGVRQIGELEDSGVAVWDLGESVRQTNMTSGPIIVQELDALGQSLNMLALEMTRFYTSVDGDMDNILIVMDWARRELGQVIQEPASSPIGRIYDRFVALLSDSGLIESENDLSVDAITFPIDQDSGIIPRKRRPRSFLSTLARMSTAYRTRSMLQVTFLELVGALEEAIANELRASTALFLLFERVDRQFKNLQRLVVREQAGQERAETDVLESLWTRLTGGNIAILRKFQNNRRLLGSLRECTKRNKAVLSAHNHRLLALRSGLETLRKRLVRPLVRSQSDFDEDAAAEADNILSVAGGASKLLAMSPSSKSSTGLAGLPDQIRGIEAAHDHLQRVREGQRSRVMRMVFGTDERLPPDGMDGGDRRLVGRNIRT